MYSEIVREARFFLDEHGSFYPEATTFILTGKYIHYLISALNTKLFEYVFKTFYAGGGLGEEGFRYKKQFVLNLPIPLPQQDETSKERHFMKVLGLTPEECKVIGIIWI